MNITQIVWFEEIDGRVSRFSQPTIQSPLDAILANWSAQHWPENGVWSHNMPFFVMVSEDGKNFVFLDQIEDVPNPIPSIAERCNRRFS